MNRVYLDYNATTPMAEEVRSAIEPFVMGGGGNPSSVHEEGRNAREVVERARYQTAELVGAEAAEIVFTSCATESNNLAIQGMAEAHLDRGKHVMTSTVEHPSVLGAFAALERRGVEVTYIPVDREGQLDLGYLQDHLRPDTTLVSLMHGNNETGVLTPVKEAAKLIREKSRALLHVDAVQTVGRLPVSVGDLGADLLTLSGHKMRGPIGAAALYVRRGLRPLAVLAGGHQERGLRGGTENVWAIVGLGAAAILALREGRTLSNRVEMLRDQLWTEMSARITGVVRNGSTTQVLPNTLNVAFEGCPGEALLIQLDLEGVSASSGSACASGTMEPSHVLTAMGRSSEQAKEALRFSLGVDTGRDDVEYLVGILPELVERTRLLVKEGEWQSLEDELWAE